MERRITVEITVADDGITDAQYIQGVHFAPDADIAQIEGVSRTLWAYLGGRLVG